MNALKSASACAVLLLTAGCGGKILYPTYYTLEIPSPPAPTANAPRRGAVAIRRFESPPYLRQTKIVYRQTAEEIGFYEYHRWADDPAETVTQAVIDSLRASQLFSSVTRYDGQGQQDYLMAGRLERLDEIDYGGPVRVEARISAELLNLRTGVTDWTGDADETLEIGSHNLDSVVAQMSRAVQQSVERLVASLDQQLPVK